MIRNLAMCLLLGLFGVEAVGAQTSPESGGLTIEAVNYDQSGTTPLTMYISDGEMRIDQRGMSMIMRPSGPQPGILLIDHSARRVDFLPSESMSRVDSSLSARTVRTGASEIPLSALQAMAPIPETVTIIRDGNPEVVPVELGEVGFFFEGDATLPGMDQAEMPPEMKEMITVMMQMVSHAYVDPTLDGSRPLAAFYADLVESGASMPAAGAMSMTSGMMEMNRDIAASGFPVWVGTATTIDLKVDGPMAGMIEGMLKKNMPGMGTTLAVSVVETISTDPVDPALFYGGGMPAEYEVRVLDGAGAGAGG